MATERKIVHIFRHGEVSHEESVDPPLSRDGFHTARNLINNLPPSMRAPTLVIVSPHTRCMQTALGGFHRSFQTRYNNKDNKDGGEVVQHFLKENITFMLDPRLQEIGEPWGSRDYYKLPSRREMNSLYKLYFTFPEEFYPKYAEGQEDDPDEDQDWYKEEGLWAGRLMSVGSLERAASFKEFLYNRPEKEIIVVTSNIFIDTLVHEPGVNMGYLEYRSCVWKPTISGRMRLVPLTFPESEMELVPDEDYSEFWPYRLSERSELFKKWYSNPTKIYKLLLQFEACKKYWGSSEMTMAAVEPELGSEAAKMLKRKVKKYIKTGSPFWLRR